MATLQQRIAGRFLEQLSKSGNVDEEKINKIKDLLGKSKKPKAEEFVKIFTLPAGGDLK